MSKVRKMINTSSLTIPVEIKGGTTVFVPPRGALENEDVQNLEQVRRFFKVEEDLREVVPRKEKKRKLNEG